MVCIFNLGNSLNILLLATYFFFVGGGCIPIQVNHLNISHFPRRYDKYFLRLSPQGTASLLFPPKDYDEVHS